MPPEIRRDRYLENRDPEAFSSLSWANIEAYFCGETDRLVLRGGDPAKYHDQPSVVCVEYEVDKLFERLLENFEQNVKREVETRRPYCSLSTNTGLVESFDNLDLQPRPQVIRRGYTTTVPKEWRNGRILSTEERNKLFNAIQGIPNEGTTTDETHADRVVESGVVCQPPRSGCVELIQAPPSNDIPGSIGTYVEFPPRISFWSKLKSKREKRNSGKPKYLREVILSIPATVKDKLRNLLAIAEHRF